MSRGGAGCVAVLLSLSACAHAGREPATEHETAAPARGEVGLASFYGKAHHGRRTASGARYDMNGLTCAHRTARFGTRLQVTDLETGRSVVVTVTDRGPFVRGRVVDLSLGAARKLGIVERGVVRVRVERID